jgi:LruC domain-containing protein
MKTLHLIKAWTGAGIITLAALLTLASCNNPEDPNLVWLLGLAEGQNNVVTNTTTAPDPADLFAPPANTSDPFSEVQFDLNTVITKNTEDFIFESTKVITMSFDVLTPVNDAQYSLVRITKTPEGNQVIFQATVDANGKVNGSFTVDTDLEVIYVELYYKGKIYTKMLTIKGVYWVNGYIRVAADTANYVFPDTDGDGVRDSLDYYPQDASRAMLVRIPEDGSYYTVAFEDLYPKPGDSDFNDFVVKVRYEEDLNAAGQVVRLRSVYRHIAKGAGYNHKLYQKIPGIPASASTFTRYGYPVDGTLPVEFTEEKQVTGADSILIFSSKESIAQSNTNVGGVFKDGKQATTEYIFSQPAAGADLGKAPFDLYLYVINTKKEIHFAGLGYTGTGSNELYLDSNGFPWALMLPGKWYWPYETGDIHAAYPEFSAWYTSYGANATDWYKHPVTDNVFPY